MARYIDANILKEKILEERDKIPLKRVERYSFGVETPYRDGQAMRGGIRKALRCLEQTPTADVAPKSEVEELSRENESLAKTVNEGSKLIRKLRSKIDELKKDRYQVLPDGRVELIPRTDIEEIKSEVAREIFEEIEKIIRKHDEYPKYGLMIDLAELKKKYTEENNNDKD